MKALIRKIMVPVFFSLTLVAQSSHAKIGGRFGFLWAGIEAAMKCSEKNFAGFSDILAKDMKYVKLSGLQDQELGRMFESIRLAAESSSGKEIHNAEEFVAAMLADPQLKEIVDRGLPGVNDAAAALTKAEMQSIEAPKLGEIVRETAKAREPKIELGASNIIPCDVCGITESMRVNGVWLILKRAGEGEIRAGENYAAQKGNFLSSFRKSLAQVSDGNGRMNLKLSQAGEKNFAALSKPDQAMVGMLAKDAAAGFDPRTRDLAQSLVLFSRDGAQTVDLANEGDRLFELYTHVAQGNNKAALKKLLDDVNKEFPEAAQLQQRRMKFCQGFRGAAARGRDNIELTAAAIKALSEIDKGHCFGNILTICK